MTSEPLEMVAETVPSSVARIRHFAVDACRTNGSQVDSDVVALLVSELATNALIHGSGDVRVRVLVTGPGVRIEVLDGSDRQPTLNPAGEDAEGGRGITLVDALSSAWGTEPTERGKKVWFELAAE